MSFGATGDVFVFVFASAWSLTNLVSLSLLYPFQNCTNNTLECFNTSKLIFANQLSAGKVSWMSRQGAQHGMALLPSQARWPSCLSSAWLAIPLAFTFGPPDHQLKCLSNTPFMYHWLCFVCRCQAKDVKWRTTAAAKNLVKWNSVLRSFFAELQSFGVGFLKILLLNKRAINHVCT